MRGATSNYAHAERFAAKSFVRQLGLSRTFLA